MSARHSGDGCHMSCSVATCKYVGGALRPHRSVRRPARCSREDSISGFWTFPRIGDPQIVESAHVTAPFPTLSVVSVQPAANPQAQAADITNAAEAHGGVPAIITIKGRLEVQTTRNSVFLESAGGNAGTGMGYRHYDPK